MSNSEKLTREERVKLEELRSEVDCREQEFVKGGLRPEVGVGLWRARQALKAHVDGLRKKGRRV